MSYQQKDYLGSYYSITDEQGKIVLLHDREEQVFSFDPCSVKLGFREFCEPETVVEPIPNSEALREGRRRKPNTWDYYTYPATYLFDRGYTGHEHLDKFDLINMNGRVYDPWLGRFLSPDPFVQAPDYSQNYNRYTYALNNPLKYTDPSGYTYHPDDWRERRSGGINFHMGYIGGSIDWSGADAYFYASNMTYDYENNVYTDLYGNTVSEDFAVAIVNSFYGQTSESDASTILLNNMPQLSSAEIENNTMWLYFRGDPTENQLNEQIQFQITAIDVAYGNGETGGGGSTLSFSFNGKITLGLQVGGNIGGLGGKYGTFLNIFSVTMLGYNTTTGELIYPGSQEGNKSQTHKEQDNAYQTALGRTEIGRKGPSEQRGDAKPEYK